jgi:hypothetical protein
MKFWNLLRWIGTAVFIALLMLSWIGNDGADPRLASPGNGAARPAPTITR